MASVRKLAFRWSSCTAPELLEPALLHAVARVLAHNSPPQPPPVVIKCCKVLKFCATDAAGRAELGAWQRLLPLLGSPATLEHSLNVLATLSELTEGFAFRNMFAAAGGVPQLLPLLLHTAPSVRLTAACILSSLSEGGLSRDLLCCQPCLSMLLHVLGVPGLCSEVAVTIVYVFTSLARHSPAAVPAHLASLGAASRLAALMPMWTDEELRQGASQLLATVRGAATAVPLLHTASGDERNNALSSSSLHQHRLHHHHAATGPTSPHPLSGGHGGGMLALGPLLLGGGGGGGGEETEEAEEEDGDSLLASPTLSGGVGGCVGELDGGSVLRRASSWRPVPPLHSASSHFMDARTAAHHHANPHPHMQQHPQQWGAVGGAANSGGGGGASCGMELQRANTLAWGHAAVAAAAAVSAAANTAGSSGGSGRPAPGLVAVSALSSISSVSLTSIVEGAAASGASSVMCGGRHAHDHHHHHHTAASAFSSGRCMCEGDSPRHLQLAPITALKSLEGSSSAAPSSGASSSGVAVPFDCY
jgi:hypothetical protein